MFYNTYTTRIPNISLVFKPYRYRQSLTKSKIITIQFKIKGINTGFQRFKEKLLNVNKKLSK